VWGAASSTIGMDESSGKYYVEYRVGGTQYSYIGIANVDSLIFDLATVSTGYSFLGATSNDWGYLSSNGYLRHNDGVAQTGGAVLSAGDILGITFDTSNKEAKWYKNGALQYTQTLTGNYPFFFAGGSYQSSNIVNFGQNPSFCGTTTAGTNADGNGKGLFKYAPPTGFLALCEDNLPTPAIADPGKHFKTVLYHGDGNNGHSITGVGFQPDLVWIKCRSNADDHTLTDVVRGADRALYSNNTNSENTSSIRLQSFDDNGFTTGSSGDTNTNGRTFCAWCWKAGGAAVSNTDGSITTQVSANPTSGFSIVKGSQTSGTTTFGHGLGKAPKMIITKQTNGTTGWYTYVKDIGYDRTLRLDQDSASASFAHWVAHPTTSVFSMGSGFGSGEDYVAYCFAEIEGFSKIGVYVGNGNADGSFVYCGFKPAWVLIKNADQNGTYWTIFDSSRKSTNPANHTLNPNLNHVEETNGGNGQIDLLSNGFKCRNTDGGINGEDINYVFMAFAESPFQTANAK